MPHQTLWLIAQSFFYSLRSASSSLTIHCFADPQLETRYFVTVKYYSSDPSPPIRTALFMPNKKEDFGQTTSYTPLWP